MRALGMAGFWEDTLVMGQRACFQVVGHLTLIDGPAN